MYQVEGKCKYTELGALQESTFRRESERQAAFADFYAVSVEDLQSSLRKLRLAVCANVYCKYLFDHSILDLKTNEVTVFLASRDRYEAWPFRNEKPPFDELCEFVTQLLPSL